MVAQKRLGAHRALRKEMAQRRGPCPSFHMNERRGSYEQIARLDLGGCALAAKEFSIHEDGLRKCFGDALVVRVFLFADASLWERKLRDWNLPGPRDDRACELLL